MGFLARTRRGKVRRRAPLMDRRRRETKSLDQFRGKSVAKGERDVGHEFRLSGFDGEEIVALPVSHALADPALTERASPVITVPCRTWIVIALCGAMTILEIVGVLLFGSIALVADGLHMSTHAGALLLAALAYSFARRYAHDPRFTFGTGKLGDLAGFMSATVLAMIASLIGYEAISRFL